MATIRCENCGCYIQDSYITCLYCNAPNKQYKAKEFGSFSSFGSSFSTDSFGVSYIDSSYPRFDFGVDKKFVDTAHDDAPSCLENSPSYTMSSFFGSTQESANNDCDACDDEPKSTTNSVDYRIALDNYRKANGYGEYSSKPMPKTKSAVVRDFVNNGYKLPRYNYGDRPIGSPSKSHTDASFSSSDSQTSRKSNIAAIIIFVAGLFVFQIILQFLLFLSQW